MTDRSRKIIESARTRVEELVRKECPLQIILFGSAARGSATRHSDVDLLVVMNTPDNIHDRPKRIWACFSDWEEDLDVIVYTPEEWAVKRSRPNAFIKKILSEGIVLHGT